MRFRSRDELLAAGKSLRAAIPLERHGRWIRPTGRRDPIDVLQTSNRDRVAELVPIRYGRMLRTPFTFLRGAAGLMASDLASTPSTALRVQACGDCHLMNFGMFATPERNLIFDINDFDETLPAPWEWDLKRLAVSFAVASRQNGHSEKQAAAAACKVAESYRTRLRKYSKQSPLEIWYDRIDEATLFETAPDLAAVERRRERAAKAHEHVADQLFPKLVDEAGDRFRLIEQPPLLFHSQEPHWHQHLQAVIAAYAASLPEERRVLFDRYQFEDFVFKVVGIGSVGTRCYVGLFSSRDQQPLLLQFKEAKTSVLEPYAGRSRFRNRGQRIVIGQRLMQSSSDIFLGWAKGARGFHFFGRQLRDMKMSAPVDEASPSMMRNYAELCGWTLARAHAKSGESAIISGYLGKSEVFDQAIGRFAVEYADQNERDHAALVAAVKKGRVEALVEEKV